MSDHAKTLRAMAHIYPHWAPACLAGADALRRGTCANCDHRFDWPDAIGCNNARGLGRDEVSPDDFCSEWAPRKDAPTEPTR